MKDSTTFINTTTNPSPTNETSVDYRMCVNPFPSWHKISEFERSFARVSIFLEPMKIVLDCQMINEDTLVGLELQTITPFRFHFHKLWLNHSIRQILSPSKSFDLNLVLNLTHSDVNRLSCVFSFGISLHCRTSRICI